MSSGSALVRLEDGTIKWTVYSGTSDILSALLFDTADEAWVNRGKRMPEPDCHCEPQPVEIWTIYGGEFGWKADGCEHRVHNHLAPHGLEVNYCQWAPGEEPVDLIEVQPDWVVF